MTAAQMGGTRGTTRRPAHHAGHARCHCPSASSARLVGKKVCRFTARPNGANCEHVHLEPVETRRRTRATTRHSGARAPREGGRDSAHTLATTRCDLLRIATFYRVTGAKRRAKQRVRRETAKAKFQRWAATVLAERRSQARPTPETRANQQETRQGPNAGKRRAETAPSYREARAYKQRATPDEMERRRLAPKRTRLTNTTQSTELGKRLRDNMEEVGRRCKAARRGDG